MPVAYPDTLPPLQRASKSRSQPAAFSIAEPRRGWGYAQAIGTDRPVFWEGQFRFGADDAIRYQLWLKMVAEDGLQEFTLPIRTEFGLVTHTCRFLDDGIGTASEEGGVWTYPVKLMARKLLIPADFTDAADLIIGLENWRRWGEMLDMSIAALPEDAP